MRYIRDAVLKDFEKKMIFLSGPRQAGKTTFAKFLMGGSGIYLNWDIKKDKKIIREVSWPKNASLVVLDELHKYAKWKNYLKGLSDEFQNKPPLLITGSARLETFRRQGDALTGRFYHYRLHPIDLAESKLFLPKLSAQERLKRLLVSGGFPEAFLHPEEAERLRNDRFDLVLQEDLRVLSKTNALSNMELLLELLRERVSQNVHYSSLAEDLSVSAPTIKNWIILLERLYLIFAIKPFYFGLARSIRKEPKIYFYDCAASLEENNLGPRVENFVASSLLKYCHWMHDTQGKDFKLYYYRDRENREVDFLIAHHKKIIWSIEVKLSDSSLSPHLEYLHQRLKPEKSIQLVLNLDRKLEIRGIEICSLGEWLEDLY